MYTRCTSVHMCTHILYINLMYVSGGTYMTCVHTCVHVHMYTYILTCVTCGVRHIHALMPTTCSILHTLVTSRDEHGQCN